jgi:cobalt-zinc-cadmium efflux system membrane fusion protein
VSRFFARLLRHDIVTGLEEEMDNDRRFSTRNRHLRIFLAAFVLVLLASCIEREGEEERAQRPAQPREEGVVRLTAVQIQSAGIKIGEATEVAMPDTYSTTGRVVPRASGQAEVFAPFPGRLIVRADRSLQVGGRVRRDELLFEVEQQFSAAEILQLRTGETELKGQIEEAEQQLAFAGNEYARAQKLFEGGAIPEKQLRAAELAAKQAETRLDNARNAKAEYEEARKPGESIRRAPIRSPISGVVTHADFAGGQQVEPAQSLLTIADFGTVWVEAPVHEQDLPEVGRATRAEIIPTGAPTHRYTGQRVWSGQVVDPLNRTLPIVFAVVNSDGVLKLGMSAEVRIRRGTTTKRLAVPRSAIVNHGAAFFVFRQASDNVFERRTVTTGLSDGSHVAILDGLQKGDRVVTQGAQALLGQSLKGLIPAEEEE